MRNIFFTIIISLLTVACNNNLEIKKTNALVKVGNKTLYKSVLEESIPVGLSGEDSIIAAEYFIHTWIKENLLYNVALKNIHDIESIDRSVENYRKSLLIYQYEEQLINERLTKEIDEQSLYDHYNRNKDKLKLEKSLVKGLFLKVPVTAPQLNEIRLWYKSLTPAFRDNLEKYSLNNTVNFIYFVDKWMDYNDILNNFPKELLGKDDQIVQKKTVEKQDAGYFYFLNITDYLLPGDNSPYEYAKSTIQEMLINQRKIDFLKKTAEDLYQRALVKGEIQFYSE